MIFYHHEETSWTSRMWDWGGCAPHVGGLHIIIVRACPTHENTSWTCDMWGWGGCPPNVGGLDPLEGCWRVLASFWGVPWLGASS